MATMKNLLSSMIDNINENSKEIADLKQNGGSGSVTKDTFEAYDKFYESIANMRVNPNTPLNIITYDGSNKPTHPSVLYCEDGFANHKYWMAYSPFPNNNNTYENPCIAYSEDGVNFISDGITNPIEDTPMEDSVKVGYNSDPHLVIVNGVMECWWRTHYQSGMNANHEVIYRKTSNDGITWSEKEELFRVEDASAGSCLSPTVIYEDGIYKIWCVYKQQVLKYYESADGLNWEYVRDINVDNSDYPTYKIWHFDIKHTVKGYEFVGCYHPTGDYNDNKYIFYAVSSDNVTYSPRTLVLTNGLAGNFDATELYRPSIIREEYGVKIYYGCRNGAGNWKIGMIEAPNPYLFNAVLKNQDRFNSILTRLTNLENGSGGSGGTDTTIACTSVSLDKTTLTFDSNVTQTLVATVEPTNTTETLSWVSNNTSIATVTNGVVTPIANGSCVITANCGSCSASCQVTVNIETENEEPTVDGVANSFADSTWTAGYYNDIGEIATFDRMHHSQLMPVGEYIVSVPVVGSLRVSYFDADKNYLNYDFGNGIGEPMGGADTNTSIDVDPEAGAYFAISYNSTDKSKVTVSVTENQFVTTAEPIACYLGNNHGSVDGEWTEVDGGTSITLNGGTWDNGILLTDGVDDNLVLPLVNAKSVVIKAKLLTEYVLNNTQTIGYVFDTRAAGTAYLLNYTSSDYIGTGASVYAGTKQFGSAGFAKLVKVGEWYYFTIVFTSNFTGNMRICSHNSGNSDFMQAEIEEIKVYDVDITV